MLSIPVGRIRDQAVTYELELSDPTHTGLILVTTPEELPVVETTESMAEIAEYVDLAGLITNRVLEPLGVSEDTLAALPPGPHRDAGLLHRSLHGDQRRWMGELPPGPTIPYLFGVHTPGEVAALMADEIGPAL